MHVALFVSALLASAGTAHASKSAGCGKALPKGLTKGEEGKSNAMTFGPSGSPKRRYLLHIPETYDVDTPAGMIWSFAGRGKDAEHQEKITRLSDKDFNSEYIVVYPQAQRGNGTATSEFEDDGDDDSDSNNLKRGLRRQRDDDSDDYDDDDEFDDSSSSDSGQQQWQGDPTSHANDVAFTLELLARLSDRLCIDSEKIYASGLSNGGGFVANILACDAVASTKFAAFAAASGAYYQNNVTGACEPDTVPLACDNNGTKVPMIFTNGGADKVISYEGGERRNSCLPSVPHFVTAWAERDGLDSKNESSTVDGTDITHYSFGQGETAGMVQSYYLPKLGHKWPTKSASDLSATRVFIEFFERWNMPARNVATGGSGSGTSTSGSGSKTSSSASATSTSKAALQMGSPSLSGMGLVVAVAVGTFWL